MRYSGRRTLVGAAVILAGIVGLNFTATDAAESGNPVPEGEFKTLVEQDAKNIETMIATGKKGGAANTSKASRAIKSSALMIAAYAQSRIGSKGADDAKLATLRDAAIKVGTAAGKKKFDDAAAGVKALSIAAAADPKASVKKVDLVAAAGEFDIEELMYQFKKTSVGGLGIEEEIKAQAKKATITPANATAMAQRVLIIADFCDVIGINGGFNAGKPKKAWDDFNKDMRVAAQGLITAAAGKPTAAALQTAFTKLDSSCVKCHDKFK